MTNDSSTNAFEGTYFIVQALLAINPDKPRWTSIAKTSVRGWETVDKTHGRLPGYRFRRFWADVLAWDHQEDAKAAFRTIKQNPQRHQLRLVQVRVSHREQLVHVNQR